MNAKTSTPSNPSTASDQAAMYRVFVSYSHDDLHEYEALKRALEACNLRVLSDRNIGAGSPFTDAIKGLITHAHLFIPLITKNAQQRPWVHQETGFAMARNIPILPIILDDAGMPTEMIAQLQALKIKADLSDLQAQLDDIAIEALVFPRPAPPIEMVQVAEWPEQRAQWLAECANRVRDLGYPGLFRQRGAFSSFCIPDADIADAVWKRRDGGQPRSDYYHHLQREERRAFEWHARRSGCRLIVDPTLRLETRGLEQTLSRLETLLDFLESALDFPVEVVVSPQARDANLTLLRDWFVADSMVPRPGGYRQTVFNWHAPTVSRWVRRFDDQFEALCRQQNFDPARSLELVMDQIAQILQQYKAELNRGVTASPAPPRDAFPAEQHLANKNHPQP